MGRRKRGCWAEPCSLPQPWPTSTLPSDAHTDARGLTPISHRIRLQFPFDDSSSAPTTCTDPLSRVPLETHPSSSPLHRPFVRAHRLTHGTDGSIGPSIDRCSPLPSASHHVVPSIHHPLPPLTSVPAEVSLLTIHEPRILSNSNRVSLPPSPTRTADVSHPIGSHIPRSRRRLPRPTHPPVEVSSKFARRTCVLRWSDHRFPLEPLCCSVAQRRQHDRGS